MTQHSWQDIRDAIAARIYANQYRQGDRLPTEPELATEFGAGRHSVRRAMAALAIEGLLSIEQGRGSFVRRLPQVHYRIGRRTRYRENLERQGLKPGEDHISTVEERAPERVSAALHLPDGALVSRLLRLGRADDTPISLGISWHEIARFPDLARRRQEGHSVTDIYADHGIADYMRRDTELHARLPDAEEARLLQQLPEQPVIVMQKTDITPDGTPIGYSESIWSAARVRFSLTTMDDQPEES